MVTALPAGTSTTMKTLLDRLDRNSIMAVKLHGLPVSITPVELLATAVGIFILFYLSTTSRKSQRPPLPPGPLGLPIFGNMFSIPKSVSWPLISVRAAVCAVTNELQRSCSTTSHVLDSAHLALFRRAMQAPWSSHQLEVCQSGE
jgi:hypothetical protein